VSKRSAVVGVLALAAFALIPATAAGMPAIAVTIVVGTAWAVTLLRRLGLSVALAGILVGWMTITFLVTSLVPLVNAPLSLTRELVYAGTAICAWALEVLRPAPKTAAHPIHPAVLVGSLLGPLAWLVGIALSVVLPSGSGLSWASRIDSSLDVWAIRLIALNGGAGIGPSANPRPLEHTLSASFLPFTHAVNGSSRALEEELLAHATAWSLLIVMSCLLAGLVVAEFASGARRAPLSVAVFSGIASLGMLTMPVTGRILDFGQINAHLVFVLVFASVLIARASRDRPVPAVALLIIAMCLLLLCWTPFAAVPGFLAMVVAWDVRGRLSRYDLATVGWWGFAAIMLAWTMSAYTAGDLLRRVFSTSSSNEAAVTVSAFTGVVNPYWLPLSAVVIGATLCVAVAALSIDRATAVVSGTTMIGFVIGAAPLILARGGIGGELEYYPAKYISLATIAAAPVLMGVGLRILTEASASAKRRTFAVVALASAVTTTALSPATIVPDRTLFAPVALATGRHVGTHAELAGRVLRLVDEAVLNVAWRLDPTFDFAVGWLQSVALPMDDPPAWNTPIRAALRIHGDDFGASAACDVVAASNLPGFFINSPNRPVNFVTADPHLSEELAAECPGANYTVTVVSAPTG